MTDDRSQSDAADDDLRPPPTSFVDRRGRDIELRVAGAAPETVTSELDPLVEMYVGFDPADRAQGIPPSHEPAIRDWLESVLVDEAVNVLAWHGDRVAGHAMLVPDEEGAYELAIFVQQDYQRAGIGTRLIRSVLAEGRDRGSERIWLTVERWNEVAIQLYRDVGFETTSAESFELVMDLDLGSE